MTNYLSQTINNIYNSDIDNKIKQLELNQIKKKKNNSEFLHQFDELKFIALATYSITASFAFPSKTTSPLFNNNPLLHRF